MKKSILVCALFLLSVSVHANYFCTGTVRHLSVSSGGKLWLGIGSYQVMSMCNVSDEPCKAWFSMATAAKLAGKKVTLAFNNSAKSGTLHCPVNSSWGSMPDPVYDFALHS